METHEYQVLAMRTLNTDATNGVRERLLTDVAVHLLHSALLLSGESGEFLGDVKAHLMYGRPLRREHLIEELGDIMWGISLATWALGASIDQVMQANIAKLAARYPEGFSATAANIRHLETEADAIISALRGDV